MSLKNLSHWKNERTNGNQSNKSLLNVSYVSGIMQKSENGNKCVS